MKANQIAQIRSFNRFYTSVIGLLDKHYLNSEFSLAEVRILYEMYHQPGGITASTLIELLNLDKGYLSRILLRLEKKKLIKKRKSVHDRRSFYLCLSPHGKNIFEKLNAASQEQAIQLLLPLRHSETVKLIDHMEAIRQILKNADI